MEDTPVRKCINIKKRTMKDGSIKEYKYEITYSPKTDKVVFGKNELISRIRKCKNKEQFDKIKELCDELGI
ncbi:hypothetical protein PV-S19_0437 [Pacmanvirus S19]|nr:hypothetical protein PV-S19_0437 [Pacmanvirus S19]